jgi:hypothetical protein
LWRWNTSVRKKSWLNSKGSIKGKSMYYMQLDWSFVSCKTLCLKLRIREYIDARIFDNVWKNKFHLCMVPHSLMFDQKAQRIVIYRDLLTLLEEPQNENRSHSRRGMSHGCSSNIHLTRYGGIDRWSSWVDLTKDRPWKRLISIIWPATDIQSLLDVPKRKAQNFWFFSIDCFWFGLEFLRWSTKKDAERLWHTSGQWTDMLFSIGPRESSENQSLKSSLCNLEPRSSSKCVGPFYCRGKLSSASLDTWEELISLFRGNFASVTNDDIITFDMNWMKRHMLAMKNHDEYYHPEISVFSISFKEREIAWSARTFEHFHLFYWHEIRWNEVSRISGVNKGV